MITLDFETCSRASLKAVGLHAYARDPSTEVLCVAWKFDDGPVQSSDTHSFDELFYRVRQGEHIAAHNAEFEFEIWNNVFKPGLPLKLSQMRCSMARAMAASLPPSLGELAAILKVPVQKDAEGAKVMRLMCQPDKKGNFIHTPEYFARLVTYCRQDVEAEYQCDLKLPHLSLTEQKLWEITARINSEGLKVDRDACEAAVALLTEHSDRLETEIDMLTGGNVRTGKQVQKMLDQFKTWGFTINDMTKDSIAEALKTPGLSPEVKRLLELRAEGSRSSVAKYQKFLTMMGADDRVRGLLRYHGASTGRWSGSGVQPQNFPRGTIKNVNLIIEAMKLRDYKLLDSLYPSVSEAASAALRGMIVADNEFFDGDFSAIEARVLVWCAGARTQLADYHAGVDTYKKMASKIYRIPADKVNDFPQRQLGKAAVLGCFGANTLVLTNSGWKHIINLTLEDKLWDGTQWVSHEGVICQGEREITECCGILATPEHRIRTRAKWVQFQELQENTTYLQSALEMGACGLSRISGELGAGCLPLWFHALATVAEYIGWTRIISGVMRLQGVVPAQKLQRIIPENTIGDTLNSARTRRIGKDYSTAFRHALLGALIPKIGNTRTMAGAVFRYKPVGWMTEGHFWHTLCAYPVGTTLHWNWTASTLIKVIARVTCDSFLGKKIAKIKGVLRIWLLKFYACKKNSQKLQTVYDVLNSGPNNCFTILSNRGPLIAHNCGYGMGAEKFIDAAKSYGVVVDEALAKHAITTFREENPEVTKLWYDVETAAKNAVKFPGQVYSAGKCKLKSVNGHLRIQLPSARVLTFPFAKLALKETKFGIREELRFTGLFQGKPVPESTYGGKIVENCLGASSPILTKRGWVAIASIRPDDELWDGLEWVKHKGLVYQGMKEVIQWWGLEVTPDHKILDGKTWRSAINLEGFALIDALKTGRSLITLRLWKPTKLGACIIQNSYAAAVDNIELKLNKCAKSLMARVRNAEKKRGTAANTFISLRPKFSKYGPTGIAALCADALNPSAPNTETTGHVEYGSTKSGLPTVKPFLPTPKLSRIGITVLSTLTALIMTGITLPVIFAWWTAAPTLLTSAILLDTLLMVVCGHLKNYGRGSSRNGVASTQSHGTLKMESRYKKFGAITYAPVFDLMDSGPRRRFTVLTSVGPVIAHNCVQAIARDLMAFAMINLDNVGLKPVLTVHDEILVDSPDSSRFAEFQEIMERVPEWGEGIPLKVGAWRGKRFRK